MKPHRLLVVVLPLASMLVVLNTGCEHAWKHEPGPRYPAQHTMDSQYDESQWRVEGAAAPQGDQPTTPPPAEGQPAR